MLVIWSTLLWYLLRWSCMLWFSHWASWWYKYRSNTRLFLITCINLSRWDERWYQCHSDFSFVTFYIRYLHLFQKWFWIIPFLPFQYNELYCFSPLTAWHTHIGLISYPNILKYDLNFGIIFNYFCYVYSFSDYFCHWIHFYNNNIQYIFFKWFSINTIPLKSSFLAYRHTYLNI